MGGLKWASAECLKRALLELIDRPWHTPSKYGKYCAKLLISSRIRKRSTITTPHPCTLQIQRARDVALLPLHTKSMANRLLCASRGCSPAFSGGPSGVQARVPARRRCFCSAATTDGNASPVCRANALEAWLT